MVSLIQELITKIGGGLILPILLLFSAHLKPALNPTPQLSPKPSQIALTSLPPTPTPSPSPQPSLKPKPSLIPNPKFIPVSLTPTPTPTPSPSPIPSTIPSPIIVTGEQLDAWFTSYSHQFSVDRQKLWQIAVCESKLNPNSRNGDYGGLYQFSPSTWRTTRTEMNMDPNPELRFNPEEAIKTAAFKIAGGGISSWPNCSK